MRLLASLAALSGWLVAMPACTSLNRMVPIQTAPQGVSRAGFRLPASGVVTSTFGMRDLMGTMRMHKGIDFAGRWGVSGVFAAAAGIVTVSQTSSSFGNWIEIRHPNGYSTRYGHMIWRHVGVGDHVQQGDLIGRFGSTGRATGTHLHFEILRNGVQVDPLVLLPPVVVAGNSARRRAEAEEARHRERAAHAAKTEPEASPSSAEPTPGAGDDVGD